MKGKSLAAACVIVPLAALALAVYLWADTARRNVDHYGFLQPRADALVVQFGDWLVWLDGGARERRAVNLAERGMAPLGDFAFFSNGDLLVYSQPRQPGLLHNLARFLRLQKYTTEPAAGGAGFYRCPVTSGACRRLEADVPALTSSFRLAIDERDRIYLADTAAFTLYKLSERGRRLAQSAEGQFKFPNQLVLRGGQLWVADTNHHRVVAVRTDTSHFAEPVSEFSVRDGREHRWPHQLAPAERGWWVNVGDSSLSHGHLIRYSESGDVLERRISPVKDPLAIAAWRGDLWVADFASPQLASTRAGVSVNSNSLRAATAQAQSLQRYYRRVSYAALGGLGVVLVLGFGAAWWLERDETLSVLKGAYPGGAYRATERPAKPLPEDGKVFWLTNTASRTLKWMSALLATGAILTLGSLFALQSDGLTALMPLLWVMGAFVLVAFGGIYWILRYAASLRLGVIGESLVMQQGRRRRTVASAREIRYTRTHLVADNVTIALGQPQHRFFDRAQLNDYIFPRLKDAEQLSPWHMTRHLWQVRDPQLVGSVVMVVMLLALYGALKLS